MKFVLERRYIKHYSRWGLGMNAIIENYIRDGKWTISCSKREG
jgi:hypothetical protein